MAAPISNLLFDSLPSAEQSALRAILEPVPLPVRTVIFEAERIPRHVYLLTSGVAAVVTSMVRGDSVEVGLFGREGLPGSVNLFDGEPGPAACFLLLEGTALRADFHKFQEQFMNLPVLHRRVLQHVQYENAVLSQLSACNRVHEVEERLARWLLMLEDRLQQSELPLTQEFLGYMLGARRSTVTVVAGTLQRCGLIEHRRGHVTIVNRQGLEDTACECYQVVRKHLQKLYRDANRPIPDGDGNVGARHSGGV